MAKQLTLISVFLFVLLAEVSLTAVTRKRIYGMESHRNLPANLAADLLNSVLVKSRQNKTVQRVKRANDWRLYVYSAPFCIPTSIGCPCAACDLCCTGLCNASNSKPCAC